MEGDRQDGGRTADGGGLDWEEGVGGEFGAGLEVDGEVVAADEASANGTEMEVGGAEGRVASDDVGALENENLTNEPEREWSGVGDCLDTAVAGENVTNEPEAEVGLVGKCGDAGGLAAVEDENVTNEPEQPRDLVEADGFDTVSNENVTNEPEREGGWTGVAATETVLDPFWGASDTGIAPFTRDLAPPGETAEGIDLRGPPVDG
jgi:hypothetical protein